ncbi:HAD hydrolase family protein [Actinomyces radicidentis]|uniref:HAD hydrolase family protein n=1 Tax=Actinomyces radicidentis TaxID=111015 RepID=UPI0026E0AAA7|nr:HAD family hydrolase [Actinomyces radicidentis]
MTRLLATDLDGTLVRRRTVTREDAEAVIRWREAGNLLAVATGRSVSLARLALADASEAAGVPVEADYVICACGTTLLDGSGTVLRTHPVPTDMVRAVTELLSRRDDCDVLATTLGGDFILHDALGLTGSGEGGIPNHFQPIGLDDLLTKDVTHMPIRVLDPDLADELAAHVAAMGEGRIDAIRSHGFFDVIAAGRTKGVSLRVLEALLEESGTELGLTAAVGDSWNDVPMFEVVDRPCAMEGAPADVVDAAGGQTTPSVAVLVDRLLVAE